MITSSETKKSIREICNGNKHNIKQRQMEAPHNQKQNTIPHPSLAKASKATAQLGKPTSSALKRMAPFPSKEIAEPKRRRIHTAKERANSNKHLEKPPSHQRMPGQEGSKIDDDGDIDVQAPNSTASHNNGGDTSAANGWFNEAFQASPWRARIEKVESKDWKSEHDKLKTGMEQMMKAAFNDFKSAAQKASEESESRHRKEVEQLKTDVFDTLRSLQSQFNDFKIAAQKASEEDESRHRKEVEQLKKELQAMKGAKGLLDEEIKTKISKEHETTLHNLTDGSEQLIRTEVARQLGPCLSDLQTLRREADETKRDMRQVLKQQQTSVDNLEKIKIDITDLQGSVASLTRCQDDNLGSLTGLRAAIEAADKARKHEVDRFNVSIETALNLSKGYASSVSKQLEISTGHAIESLRQRLSTAEESLTSIRDQVKGYSEQGPQLNNDFKALRKAIRSSLDTKQRALDSNIRAVAELKTEVQSKHDATKKDIDQVRADGTARSDEVLRQAMAHSDACLETLEKKCEEDISKVKSQCYAVLDKYHDIGRAVESHREAIARFETQMKSTEARINALGQNIGKITDMESKVQDVEAGLESTKEALKENARLQESCFIEMSKKLAGVWTRLQQRLGGALASALAPSPEEQSSEDAAREQYRQLWEESSKPVLEEGQQDRGLGHHILDEAPTDEGSVVLHAMGEPTLL